MTYEKLLSPGKIGNVTTKNRVVMTAMGVGVAEPNGMPGPRWYGYVEERAKNDVGLIITGICRVNNTHGVGMPTQLALSRNRNIAPLKKGIDMVHSYGTKMFIQLQHAGRQNVNSLSSWWMLTAVGRIFPGFWKLFSEKLGRKMEEMSASGNQLFTPKNVSASAVPMDPNKNDGMPRPTRALRIREIRRLENQFARAARRAQKAGADGIELHAGHGYLIQQFLSPETNRRDDEYGGSLENRMRFLLNIIKKVRKLCGDDFPISVRLSVNEFYSTIGEPDRGLQFEEGLEIAKILSKSGIQMLNITNGNYETMNTIIEPMSYDDGWRASFVKKVKEAVDIPVCAVGIIRTPEQAEAQLQDGVQDFIGLGRPLLADPQWVKKAEEGRSGDIQRCICCLSCFESMTPNSAILQPIECAMNPKTCREFIYNEKTMPKDGNGRNVVIAGAGPAGMTAARELASRDYHVSVYEKRDHAGGQLNMANKPPHKDRMNWAIHDLQHRAELAGAKFNFGEELTPEKLEELKPDIVLLASGGRCSIPTFIPGTDRDNVYVAADTMEQNMKISGKDIVVVGSGMTGLEAAEYYSVMDNRIYVIEMLDKIGPGIYYQHYQDVVPKLKEHGAKFYPATKLTAINDGSVTIQTMSGVVKDLPADVVLFAIGTKPVVDLKEAAEKVCRNVYEIGDANATGNIRNATRSALETVSNIH